MPVVSQTTSIMNQPPSRPSAIILCGGESVRMRTSKAWLPFGDETLLQRVARRVAIAVDPVVIVAAAGQALPPLPLEFKIARDTQPRLGPLQGLHAGLTALPSTIEFVYATATDVPFFEPRWIARLAELIGDRDLAIVQADGFLHPLAALYRREPTLGAVEQLLRSGRRRLLDLVALLDTKIIEADDLRSVDPTLQTLRNLNTPDDYALALEDQEKLDGDRPNSQADSAHVR